MSKLLRAVCKCGKNAIVCYRFQVSRSGNSPTVSVNLTPKKVNHGTQIMYKLALFHIKCTATFDTGYTGVIRLHFVRIQREKVGPAVKFVYISCTRSEKRRDGMTVSQQKRGEEKAYVVSAAARPRKIKRNGRVTWVMDETTDVRAEHSCSMCSPFNNPSSLRLDHSSKSSTARRKQKHSR